LGEEVSRLDRQIEIAEAKVTVGQRLKEDDSDYGVHMRHCYPKGGLEFGERAWCKYGEDDICPAAMYEDPWKEYLAWEERQDAR
jgi:hypothetical protein